MENKAASGMTRRQKNDPKKKTQRLFKNEKIEITSPAVVDLPTPPFPEATAIICFTPSTKGFFTVAQPSSAATAYPLVTHDA